MADGTAQTASDNGAIDASELLNPSTIAPIANPGAFDYLSGTYNSPGASAADVLAAGTGASSTIGSYFAAVPLWAWLGIGALVVLKVAR
jgi:hypothetical protein